MRFQCQLHTPVATSLKTLIFGAKMRVTRERVLLQGVLPQVAGDCDMRRKLALSRHAYLRENCRFHCGS